MTTVVLLGTLDTKGVECAFVRDRLVAEGCDVVVVDTGITAASSLATVTSDAVAAAAGQDRARLVAAGDRGRAIAVMADGAARVVEGLHADGRLDGIIALGGSGGSSIAAAAMRCLPIGLPKVLVSTMASGDTRPYVDGIDVTLVNAVVDIAGINRVSERILANAAVAIGAMARASEAFASRLPDRPRIGATMFGVTTPAVTAAREVLEARGYEVLVFHAIGSGGRAMEGLIRRGVITGVLDLTTSELADELVGGQMSAGPDRLEVAGALGLPQVVSLGALDIVNFGPLDTVPPRFRDRTLYRHNAAVTLMRTTAEECAQLGRILARKLNAATGPTVVFIPAAGLSAIDVPGGPFCDASADAALIRELRAALRPDMEVVELATDINDPAFGRAMAERLDELYRSWAGSSRGARPEEVHDETGIEAAVAAGT